MTLKVQGAFNLGKFELWNTVVQVSWYGSHLLQMAHETLLVESQKMVLILFYRLWITTKFRY